jgi:hypothetical protein
MPVRAIDNESLSGKQRREKRLNKKEKEKKIKPGLIG